MTPKKRTKTSAKTGGTSRYYLEMPDHLVNDVTLLGAAHGLARFNQTALFILSWAVNTSTITPEMEAMWKKWETQHQPPPPQPLPGDEWKRPDDGLDV
jgi:hypothetical protein